MGPAFAGTTLNLKAALMLTETADYETLYRDFRWNMPARFNIATACCDRHADGSNRLALIYVDEDGGAARTSFDELQAMSSRFANVLKADGLDPRRPCRGVPVAVAGTASRPSGGVPLGPVSVPLFTLFGEDALEFRLPNSGAKAVVTDEGGWEKLAKIRDRLPELKNIYVIGKSVPAGAKSFWASIESASADISRPSTLRPTIPPSSSTPRAPREIRKARCTPIACCSVICPMSRWCTTSCRNPAT